MNSFHRHNFGFLPAAVIFLLLVATSEATAQDFALGKIVERVTCLKDASQSYALYLPGSYTKARRWPILYAFDPGARGALPVERFKEAAEKYGYIVAGSNNSRNGPGVNLSEIIASLLEDTSARLAIDESRAYTTGFSGGARVASVVAFWAQGRIAGVIGCGAGFSPEAKPSKDLPFVFYGVAGSEDFNLIEVRQLVKTLEELGATARMAEFEGEHSWPPAVVCTQAIEWMELQAMKSKRRARDEKLIAELFARRAEQANRDEAAKKTFEAYLEFDALAKDFQGLADVTEFAVKADHLKSSKEVKEGFKQYKQEEQLQEKYLRDFYATRERLKSDDNRVAVLQDLRTMVSDLRKKAENTSPGTDRTVARRTMSNLRVMLNEEAAQYRFQKLYGELAATLMLAAEIRPDNPQSFYALARAQSLAGQKRESVESLKKAVEKGFNNFDELKTNPDLEPIRNDKAFTQLIESLSKSPKPNGDRDEQRL
ncbi:MAG: hypothetical protein JST85_09900 [Acidobacteria bacterium]|nr:hypothetical protein [Acidobacteriota bacterium]